MTVASLKLQEELKAAVADFVHMRDEGLDLYNLYWKGGVTTDISGLSGGSPVAHSVRLTKNELSSGLVLADQLGNVFFENGSVTTGDYMSTCQTLQYGSTQESNLVSAAVEGFCNKLVNYVKDCVALYNKCRNIENFYGAVLYTTVSGLGSGTDVVPGAEMTKDETSAAIALVHQFQLFMQNSSVTSDYYKTTLGLWGRF